MRTRVMSLICLLATCSVFSNAFGDDPLPPGQAKSMAAPAEKPAAAIQAPAPEAAAVELPVAMPETKQVAAAPPPPPTTAQVANKTAIASAVPSKSNSIPQQPQRWRSKFGGLSLVHDSGFELLGANARMMFGPSNGQPPMAPGLRPAPMAPPSSQMPYSAGPTLPAAAYGSGR